MLLVNVRIELGNLHSCTGISTYYWRCMQLLRNSDSPCMVCIFDLLLHHDMHACITYLAE